ncbi:SAM-dependent methyltransferase [Paenalcaligenes hominis]|uniref:SAM-dependent methyltransferase n=1 Tax=Paenalcaligenes hominis TaxID=643674 RepID=A0A1U9JYT8_9BURK|nr:methyltransferase domain-containing protein [Paenalcaligenes hominis]AQS50938.1 SAM-dependent methyltransferase [Paenalcaligenes hominis]
MNRNTDNFWHKKFDQSEYFYGQDPNDFLRETATHLPRGGRVLSLGEGEGRNAVYLAELGFQVTALDSAQSGLDKVTRLAQNKNVTVTTLWADLADYVFEPCAWDGIISIFCHLPPAVRQRVHTQIPQALTANGVFLLEAYTPKQLDYKTGGPSNIALLYQARTLAAELQPLAFTRLVETERYIHEGQGHQGQSAVVQVIATQST